MAGINVINTGVDGGISGLKDRSLPDNNQKQAATSKEAPREKTDSGDDDGVVINLSKQAQDQLRQQQAVQEEAQRLAKKNAAEQSVFQPREAAPPPPPPPPPPPKQKESLSFFGQNQERLETRKAQADREYKAEQRRFEGFVNSTTQFLSRLSGVQADLSQKNAANTVKEPNPQDLITKLDLLA